MEHVTSGNSTNTPSAALPRRHFTQNHFDLTEEKEYGDRIQLFNAIAEQIWREQQLVSTRMQWNFTFQGFLAGIYVFAGSSLDDVPRSLVQGVLSASGFLVALFCMFGVMAAQRQSTRLKRHWVTEFHQVPRPADPGKSDIRRGAFPQPFSTSRGSISGRFASLGVCGVLMAMWLAMMAIAIEVKFFKDSGGTFACELKTGTNARGDLTIICKPSAAKGAPSGTADAARSSP